MTYRTHREFAVCFALIANMIVYKMGLTYTGYYINMIVMLLFAKQGALFPDVDHIWKNVKEKTVINYVINKLIHITGGKHRSWQTHSWDIWLVTFITTLYLNNKYLNEFNKPVMLLIILGIWSGWFSHLFSDMLSSGGVRVICWLKKSKVTFVPKQANMVKNLVVSLVIIMLALLEFVLQIGEYQIIGGVLLVLGIILLIFSIYIKNMRFNTGGDWEKLVYKFTVTSNVIFLIISLIFPVL